MDKIRTVKIKNSDGSISEESYTISVAAKDVDMKNGKDLQDTIGDINVDTDGNISEQLKNLSIDIQKKIYFFDTVADMKNANLKVGDYVCTLGYYKTNDGGGAEYKIAINSSNYYETLNNELKAELIIKDNFINPLQFGAIGDGVTDNAFLLNSLLVRYNKINVTGDFKINSSLWLNENAMLIGNKKYNIILPNQAGVSIVINNNNVTVDGICVKCLSTDFENNTIGIRIKNGKNCIIKNSKIYNCYYGIKMDVENNGDVSYLRINNNEITGINGGIFFGNADEEKTFLISNVYITNNTIHDGIGEVSSSSLNNGIKISRSTKNVVIDNNIIFNMKADGIDGYKSGDTLQITNNQIYNNGECALEIKDGTTYDDTVWGYSKNLIVSNNIFYGHPGVDVILNGTPYTVTTIPYKMHKNSIISNNIFKDGNVAIRVSTSNVSINNNIINNYTSSGINLYDGYAIENISFKNIDIYENILNDATIRVVGANFYTHIYNNSITVTNNNLEPIYSSSPYTILGDNSIEGVSIPYVRSNTNMVRTCDRWVMIPFTFNGISQETILSFQALPKELRRKTQLISGYVVTDTNVADVSTNLVIGVKSGNTNQFYSPTSGSLNAGDKMILRSFNSYTSFTDEEVKVTVKSSQNMSGYVVLYYAFA